MGFIKKIWKDRKTEYPNRRLLTKEDGSKELVTVSREEGIISEEGDAFSEENMNDLEERISNAFTWKTLVANQKGAGSVSIPENANEIAIKTNIDSLGIIPPLVIPMCMFQDDEQSFRGGYHQISTKGGSIMYDINKTTITLKNVFLNEKEVTSTTKWNVYYR